MTPQQAIERAAAGDVAPVYLVTGEETYIVEQVVAALRRAAVEPALAQFNEEKLVAGETDVDRVLGAARMFPMMGKRRLVLVRSLERWEGRGQDDDGAVEVDASRASALDRLADYASAPVPSTCLLLVAAKLDGRRKIVSLARKGGWLVSCEPLGRGELPGFISREAAARGHKVSPEVADLLAEVAGPDLACVADALERLSLFVGPGSAITEDAVATTLVRMRQSTVWELLNAIGRRDLGAALRVLEDVYDPRDRGVRLLGLLAWSLRQLIKFDSATRAGAGPEEAARRAGAPPFKARELAAQVRSLRSGELARWLVLLAETDLALKGSKRPPRATVEDAIMHMCGAG